MSDALRVSTSSSDLTSLDADRAALAAEMAGSAAPSTSGVSLDNSNRNYVFNPTTGTSSSSGHTKASIPINQNRGMVNVGGMMTTEASALASGSVIRAPDGSLQLAEGEGQQQQQQQAATTDDTFASEPQQVAFGQAVDGIPEHAVNSAMGAAVAAFSSDGGDVTGVISALMRHGLSPDEAQARFEQVDSTLRPAWDRALTSEGLADDEEERQEFYTWARQKGQAFSSAINQAIQGNSTKEVRALAAQYVRMTTPNQSDLAGEGIRSEYVNGVLYALGEGGERVPASSMRIKRGKRD